MNKKRLMGFVLLTTFMETAALGISFMVSAQAWAGSNQTEPRAGEVWKEPVTGMEFVWIPAGEFIMGSNEGHELNQPAHPVHVEGFWMGRYEVTQGQWKAIMNNNPAHYKKGDNYPIEMVSWNDAQDFIQKLNGRGGNLFRLPTEAEWEYACKAGTPGQRNGELRDIAWFAENSNSTTHLVGQKKPNVWGLYDMLGNVWEWCQDWWGVYNSYYIVNNPTGPSSGSTRVFRGGSFDSNAESVGADLRRADNASFRLIDLGLRLVRLK
jgi:formylglycine-generating enzyme required for sulfatase activity